jgi:hypothetical protein
MTKSLSNYWTDEEKLALEKAETFQHLTEVALLILNKMPQPIVQVCGPISTGGAGSMEKNMRRFQLAIDFLAGEGLNTFDQLPFQDAMMRISTHLNDGTYDMDILEIFYRGIFESGHIKKGYFLPDWQSSVGATWERNLLTKIGLPIEEYPDHLFRKILQLEN